MKWMLALIVACNFQLVHKSCSIQIYHSSNMLSSEISHHFGTLSHHKIPFSTNCILISHKIDNTRRLIGDPRIACGVHMSYKSGNSGASWTGVGALVRYFRSLRWTPIPLGLGFAYIAYQQLRHVKKREASKISSSSPSDLLASDFQISFYKMLPLRASSRFIGWVNTVELPLLVRKPLLKAFVTTYGCNVDEAIVEDLYEYRSLGEFFRRSLKPEVRPIYPGRGLVSPCDGTILHYGTVENGLVEQVKGITYSLKSFLGSKLFQDQKHDKISDHQFQQNLLSNKDNILHHFVVYLAPGDYHKFHSPTNWTVQHRRHFPGELFSVRPGFVNWIAGLFSTNERVVYTGEWEHGFFSLTAVGATNVGSIKVYFDETLETNKKKWKKGQCEETCFVSENNIGVTVEKGNPFGEFNLGSTVVVIFEAPKDMKFTVQSGQRIKFGELIGMCNADMCEAA